MTRAVWRRGTQGTTSTHSFRILCSASASASGWGAQQHLKQRAGTDGEGRSTLDEKLRPPVHHRCQAFEPPHRNTSKHEWAQTVKGGKGERSSTQNRAGEGRSTLQSHTLPVLCPHSAPPVSARLCTTVVRRSVGVQQTAAAPVCRCAHKRTTEIWGGGVIFRRDSILEGVLVCRPAEGQHVDTFSPFPRGVMYGAYP